MSPDLRPVLVATRTCAAELSAGFAHPLRTFRYVALHPRLLVYAIPAALIVGGLLIATFWLVGTRTGDWLALLWDRPSGDGWWSEWLLRPLWWTTWALALVALGLVGALVCYGISMPIAGPFLALLAEKVEHIETGFEAPFDPGLLLRGLLLSVRNVALLVALQLALFAGLGLLQFIPLAGQIAAAIVTAIVAPLAVGLSQLDFPTSARLWTLGEQVALVRTNFPRVYGFSLACFLLLYVPLLNLTMAPICVVAATRLVLELEREGRLTAPDRRKALLAQRSRG